MYVIYESSLSDSFSCSVFSRYCCFAIIAWFWASSNFLLSSASSTLNFESLDFGVGWSLGYSFLPSAAFACVLLRVFGVGFGVGVFWSRWPLPVTN